MKKSLMIVPSLDCPAGCGYCFGPNRGGPVMTEAVVDAIVSWVGSTGWEGDLDITFHGGEPLTAGAGYFRAALARLADGLSFCRTHLAVQSNLWQLDDEFLDVLCEYGVSIGTSLDGPEHINDSQRGAGYFRRTMKGIELARSRGLDVGCVCTFTSRSAVYAEEIFEFFRSERLDFTIHPALRRAGSTETDVLALPPEAHGDLLEGMLYRYLASPQEVRITTLDSLCRGISARRGGTCVFGDCLGGYLAVGPEGGIYPCQRFVELPDFRIGNVLDKPSMGELRSAPAWRAFEGRQERVRAECGECAHMEYCLGGCPYNVLAERGGFSGSARDPYCPSYRRIFELIIDLALKEVFSPENLAAVIEGKDPGAGFLQRGRLLSLMSQVPRSR